MKTKVRHFDFVKKTHRPNPFLMWVAKTFISRPDFKKRGASITKRGMEPLEGKPYLLFINHASMVDFNMMLLAAHPQPVNNVMSMEGFNTYTEPLMRALGVLGKRKYVTDTNLIRHIRYCLHELKTVFVLFAEARYSLDGATSFLPDTLGRLVKIMKVPAAMLRIHGNFVTCPQWNKINKMSRVEAEMFPIVTAEEVASLSADEIQAKIREAYVYDDWTWQYENRVRIDHPERAKGLHCLLYKCPRCGTERQTDSEGTVLRCLACGKTWQMDEYGRLSGDDGVTEFAHIPDWSAWERQCVREEIRNGTYRFEDIVRVETLPGSRKFYPQGEGRLVQTAEGTTLTCQHYGEPFTLFRPAYALESMHIEYDYLGRGDCADISIPDDSFWCYLSLRDAVTKLSFATEEIYFFAREKREAEKKARAAGSEKTPAEPAE